MGNGFREPTFSDFGYEWNPCSLSGVSLIQNEMNLNLNPEIALLERNSKKKTWRNVQRWMLKGVPPVFSYDDKNIGSHFQWDTS